MTSFINIQCSLLSDLRSPSTALVFSYDGTELKIESELFSCSSGPLHSLSLFKALVLLSNTTNGYCTLLLCFRLPLCVYCP